MTINGNMLTADDGKMLTNGDVYSTQVYLGIHDSPENWTEVDADAVPQPSDGEEEQDDTEVMAMAAKILLGVM